MLGCQCNYCPLSEVNVFNFSCSVLKQIGDYSFWGLEKLLTNAELFCILKQLFKASCIYFFSEKNQPYFPLDFSVTYRNRDVINNLIFTYKVKRQAARGDFTERLTFCWYNLNYGHNKLIATKCMEHCLAYVLIFTKTAECYHFVCMALFTL